MVWRKCETLALYLCADEKDKKARSKVERIKEK
jgi:hypothetical protein